MRIITTENAFADVCRYLRRWTNRPFVDEALRSRHPGLSADRRRRKAADVAASVSQGLELLDLSEGASLQTKPLPLFYAAEAFAKAVAIVAHEHLDGDGLRSHGLKGVKKRRYFIRTLTCKVAGGGSSVWANTYSAVDGDWVRFRGAIDGVDQVYSYRIHETPRGALPRGSEVKLSELLRRIPELGEDVELANWGGTYAIHAPYAYLTFTSGPPMTSEMHITLRHAHSPEIQRLIARRRNATFPEFEHVRDHLDITELRRPLGPAETLRLPVLHADVFGELYCDLGESNGLASEFLNYFAALFILSDVVRYQGQWRRLLDDHPEEAILTDRFSGSGRAKTPESHS